MPFFTRCSRFALARPLRYIAMLLFMGVLSFSRPSRAQDGEFARLVNGLARALYFYAWPSAKYESVECCTFEPTQSGDVAAFFQLNGRSAFDGGPLWTKVRIVVDRNWDIVDMGFGENNAILAQPGETMGALGAVLAELNARAREQRGRAPSPAPYPAPPTEAPYPAPSEAPATELPSEPQPIDVAPPASEQDSALPDANPDPSRALPALGPSDRRHDGFYLRMSLGLGSLAASFDDQHPSGDKIEGSGGAGGLELRIGGSPVPGFVIGGGVIAEGGTVTLKRTGFPETDRDLYLLLAGPMIDIYPAPSKGFHLGALLGVSLLGVADSKSELDSAGFLRQTWGGGGSLSLGYDFWVARQWSLGPALQLSGALSKGEKKTARELSAQAGSVLATFTVVYQ